MSEPSARPKRWMLVGGLVVVAVVQFSLLTKQLTGAPAPRRIPVRVLMQGDTLAQLRAFDSAGKAITVSSTNGRPTLLLAFDTSCVWCDAVASTWRTSTGAAGRPRLVGITKSPLAAAQRYVTAKGWQLDALYQLDRSDQLGVERALVGKTPWVFVLDGVGRLQLQEHGAEIDRAIATIALSAGKP